MIKTLYEYKVDIIYNGESKEPDRFFGYMETYKDAFEIASGLADEVTSGAIEPEQTIISIKRKVVGYDKDTN